MTRNTIQNIVRTERRERKFGPDDQCVLCGYANPVGLLRVDRSLLEEHHVVFEATDDELTVPICRTCHAEVHEDLRSEGVSAQTQPTVLELVINALRALKTFLPKLGEACDRWADMLEQLMAALDSHFPGWRDLPQARTD